MIRAISSPWSRENERIPRVRRRLPRFTDHHRPPTPSTTPKEPPPPLPPPPTPSTSTTTRSVHHVRFTVTPIETEKKKKKKKKILKERSRENTGWKRRKNRKEDYERYRKIYKRKLESEIETIKLDEERPKEGQEEVHEVKRGEPIERRTVRRSVVPDGTFS